MPTNHNDGPLNAEQLLFSSSDREALDLGEVPEEAMFRRVETATSVKHQHPIALAWRRHISLSVPHNKCRDHLGM